MYIKIHFISTENFKYFLIAVYHFSERQKTFLPDCFIIKFKQAATETSWNIETLHVPS